MSIHDIKLKAVEQRINGKAIKLHQSNFVFYCRPDIMARESRFTQAKYIFLAKFHVGAGNFLDALGIKTAGKKQFELDEIAKVYLEPLIEGNYNYYDLKMLMEA